VRWRVQRNASSLGFSISIDGSERRIAPKAVDKFEVQIPGDGHQTARSLALGRAGSSPVSCLTAVAHSSWFVDDSPLEEAVSSEPVSESPKFPASSELTGIFGDWGSSAPEMLPNSHFDQCLAGYFPTHPNREIFGGLQGI
jgi:hypothetical protein